MFEALLERLDSRRAPLVIIACALALSATSLGGGRTLDDWVIAVVARGEGGAFGLSTRLWDSFSFTTGESVQNTSLVREGVLLPWWTAPALKLAFFRPLAALTHVLDEAWWPTKPALMHAHSLLWFALLLLIVWVLYRRLLADGWLPNLAFALYAWDDSHGATLSWLANRSALVSGVFGCASIAAHDAWRRGGGRRYGLAAIACYLMSCLASELAVGALAYLLAYAVFLDGAPLRQRLRSILGYVVCTLVWRAGWSFAGYGAHGSGAYVDPLGETARFLVSAPGKWLCLLQGQLGLIPADFGFLGPDGQQRLWGITGLVTLCGAVILLRTSVADARGRFWLGGALLSLAPMAASFPSDRLLIFVGLGFMPLLARAFQLRLMRPSQSSSPSSWGTPGRVLTLSFLAVHAVIAPVLLPLRAAQMSRMAQVEGAAFEELCALRGAANETLIVLNAPGFLLASYAPLQARARGMLGLPRIYVLSATDSALTVTRSGAAELSLRAENGFLRSALERHYRSSSSSLAAQGPVELTGLTARVVESLPDGHPAVLGFAFDRSLSDFVFVCWTNGRFRRCELPALGESRLLVADDLGRVLFSSGAVSAS